MSEYATSVVVCACIEKDGKIFIARRALSKAFYPGKFELLGGHLEHGEQPQQTLIREIKEELAVDVTVGALIDAFTFTDGNVTILEIIYLCTLKDPTVEPTLNPDDHSESCWIGQDEIDIFKKEDEEAEALRKAFEVIGER